MRKSLLIPVIAFALAGIVGTASASDDEMKIDAPQDQWLTVAQIAEKFTSQGYDVRQVKAKKAAYEVYAIDKDGRRIETYVHPVTGEPLKREREDD
ncbi:PepSY domain-containing protein [Chelativorans xinjiangense]|uniref:PepSY domain-containing protein n=1 Tax=Chelativorans xinjiangense TaxID=2681485 RepID=UPI0013579105|nr:PepSY domain-containing protein [Chelativorans xinjiangense]